MANFGFSLRSALGLIPKTEKIESQNQILKEEFEKLNAFAESDKLKEYLELESYIQSSEFIDFKKNILSLDFKQTNEYQKEKRFFKLQKNKKITNYFKVLNSEEYKEFLNTDSSDNLSEYLELEAYLLSDKYKNNKIELSNNLKAEQKKKKDYTVQKKSKKIKDYYKTLNSKQLELHNQLTDSAELSEYEELKEFTASLQLKEFKIDIKNQLKTEKSKKKELSKLKKHPEIKAYNKLLKKQGDEEIEKPKELIEYEELLNYINSNEYQQKLTELEYSNTEEYKKEQKFASLKKEQKFKAYFKFKSSKQLTEYNTTKDSDYLKQYEELEAYVTSQEYDEAINSFTYSNSDDFNKGQKFNELKISTQIKNWVKYKKSKPYLLFLQVKDSDLLKEFEELQELINSDKFKEYKIYMLDKEKYQKTDEHNKEQRYFELKKSDDIKWYYAIKDSNKFDELKAWNITFEDDFTTGKVEEEKWMNSFFWGKMLINDRYVVAGDKHFFTDNKNVELNGTSLKIITKKEKTKGKVWHPVNGFSTQEFNYTSGMLSTAHSFRQQYGKFEAKIKINDYFPVYQAFWLKGEKILPEVDVFKFNMDKKNRFQMSAFWGDPANAKNAQKKISKINGASFAKDYFIYTLDWTEKKLTWKINGIEIFSTSQGIPNEPLYLLLSSGIHKKPTQDFTPAAFEIDWVRCYEKI